MKLYAPKYYKDFICIADKCTHSCCIGWEIDIDENTLSKYILLNHPYSAEIQKSIINNKTPHFQLCNNVRCYHLDNYGLCKIIKNVGEEYLCGICREHPRFYNFTNNGKEVGIGMSCVEACRIILNSDNFDEIVEIDSVDGDVQVYDFDAISNRDTVFRILKDNSIDFYGKVEMIFDYFDLYIDENDINTIVGELEYLDISHKKLFSTTSLCIHQENTQDMLSRIMAYFVFRHCSEAQDFDEFFAGLGFSVLCTKLIEQISTIENIYDVARIVSEEIEYSEENTERIKSMFYEETF